MGTLITNTSLQITITPLHFMHQLQEDLELVLIGNFTTSY
jgi:hypothetical protein